MGLCLSCLKPPEEFKKTHNYEVENINRVPGTSIDNEIEEKMKTFEEFLEIMDNKKFSTNIIYGRYLRFILGLTKTYCGMIGLYDIVNVEGDETTMVPIIKLLSISYEEDVMRISFENNGKRENNIYSRLYSIFDSIYDILNESISTTKITSGLNKDGYYLIVPIIFNSKIILLVLRNKRDFHNIAQILSNIDFIINYLKEFIDKVEKYTKGEMKTNVPDMSSLFSTPPLPSTSRNSTFKI